MMKTIKTEVKIIFIIIISSLRAGEWFLREPQLSEDGQSHVVMLSIPCMQSVRDWYLRVPAESMSNNTNHASERLNDGGPRCGVKLF